MYCMCEYKNNKSEAFTAVISLTSLYNSVACHETHMHTQSRTPPHTYISICIYSDAHTPTRARMHTHTHTRIFFAMLGGK